MSTAHLHTDCAVLGQPFTHEVVHLVRVRVRVRVRVTVTVTVRVRIREVAHHSSVAIALIAT